MFLTYRYRVKDATTGKHLSRMRNCTLWGLTSRASLRILGIPRASAGSQGLRCTMTKVYEAGSYEFFVQFDRTAEVYELFLSETGEDYIGCFDSLAEARAYARQYARGES